MMVRNIQSTMHIQSNVEGIHQIRIKMDKKDHILTLLLRFKKSFFIFLWLKVKFNPRTDKHGLGGLAGYIKKPQFSWTFKCVRQTLTHPPPLVIFTPESPNIAGIEQTYNIIYYGMIYMTTAV